ncbi:MAG TPA: hypothetical protein VEX15_07435 [Nocardioidaceae bacterium]|nr:hypothetical protein [Nocardioidaceae bacterium]
MTWDAYHRREAALRSAVAVIDRRRDGQLPWHELDAARAAFDGPTDLLLALQMRWHTRLAGHVDRLLAGQPMDLRAAVIRAWQAATADLPGVRAALDTHDDEPALQTARAKELAYLASAAGLAELHDPAAVAVGHEIRSDAQRMVALDPVEIPDHVPTGWVARVLQALAA